MTNYTAFPARRPSMAPLLFAGAAFALAAFLVLDRVGVFQREPSGEPRAITPRGDLIPDTCREIPGCRFRRRAEARNGGNVLGSGPPAHFLAAASQQRRRLDTTAQKQRPNAFRSAELVCRERGTIRAEPVEGEWPFARCLDGIDEAETLGKSLNHASLGIRRLKCGGRGIDHGNAARVIHRERRPDPGQHAFVFYRRAHRIPAGETERSRLRGPRSEDDIRRLRPEGFSNLPARPLDNRTRHPPFRMNG